MSEPALLEPALLELRAVRAGYEGLEVLHGIDLTMQRATVTAVLGANGAGKSTLLSVISGSLHPTSGTVALDGKTLDGVGPAQRVRHGICLIPEGRGVFPNLTVRENLWVMTYAGVGRTAVEDRAFGQFPRLAERRNQLAGTLSGGEQQMLALARALATAPRLLLLDELSMGLAPLVVEDLYRHVPRLASSGVTVVLVEQFARMALAVADVAVVMAGGRIVTRGKPAEVAETLHETYLAGRAGPVFTNSGID
jgi:branched-chain amino acid transport system ATP-binding protein